MKNNNILFSLTETMLESETKNQIKKPRIATKLSLTAAALVMVLGIFNINAIASYVQNLFVTPIIGISEEGRTLDIKAYYNANTEPVFVECSKGTFEIKHVTKISGEDNMLSVQVRLADRSQAGKRVNFILFADDRAYTSDHEIREEDKNFAWIDFNLLFTGAKVGDDVTLKIHDSEKVTIPLKPYEGNIEYGDYAEYDGKVITAFVNKDTYDRIEFACKDFESELKGRSGFAPHDYEIIAENGEKLNMIDNTNWWVTNLDEGKMNYQMVSVTLDNPKRLKIGSIKINAINGFVALNQEENKNFEITVPNENETLKTGITYNLDGILYELKDVTLKDGKIIYSDNSFYNEGRHIDFSNEESRKENAELIKKLNDESNKKMTEKKPFIYNAYIGYSDPIDNTGNKELIPGNKITPSIVHFQVSCGGEWVINFK